METHSIPSFECLHCNTVSVAQDWNDATMEEAIRLSPDMNYNDEDFTWIEEAVAQMDRSAWFACPNCHEHVYNYSLELKHVPLFSSPISTNEMAKQLLDESW